MNDNYKKSNEAAQFLDNLTSFLADDDLSVEELAEDLRTQGVDPDQLKAKLHNLLREYTPTWSDKAERERLAALNALKAVRETGSLTRSEIVDQIKELIAGMLQLGNPVEAGAYHQKFQEATDIDLRSLLQDLRTQYELLKIQNKEDAK